MTDNGDTDNIGTTLGALLTAVDFAKNKSMVSFVSRRYMRVVNESLMVCLAYSNRKTKCQNYRKISRN